MSVSLLHLNHYVMSSIVNKNVYFSSQQEGGRSNHEVSEICQGECERNVYAGKLGKDKKLRDV